MHYLVIGPTNLDIQHYFSPQTPQTSQTVGGKSPYTKTGVSFREIIFTKLLY